MKPSRDCISSDILNRHPDAFIVRDKTARCLLQSCGMGALANAVQLSDAPEFGHEYAQAVPIVRDALAAKARGAILVYA